MRKLAFVAAFAALVAGPVTYWSWPVSDKCLITLHSTTVDLLKGAICVDGQRDIVISGNRYLDDGEIGFAVEAKP